MCIHRATVNQSLKVRSKLTVLGLIFDMSVESKSEKGQPVEGEPGVWWCARHAKTKTRLRCGRCETPICPKCTKYGPTGARCPACSSNRSVHIYQVSPQQYGIAVAVAFVLGSALGFVASFANLLILFYAPAAGTLVGKAISAATGHKRGNALAAIAALGLLLGAFVPIIGVPLAIFNAARNPASAADITPLLLQNVANPFTWLYVVLAIPGAWYWLRDA
ncbi:MAG TPA: hypothetical protein VF681_14855 [Abditibacteriaceae bacterium]